MPRLLLTVPEAAEAERAIRGDFGECNGHVRHDRLTSDLRPGVFPGGANETRTLDPLLANYWRRGQCESLPQVTRLITVVWGQLRVLRLLYFRAVWGHRLVLIF
jgi:hypothetical protein